MPNMPTPEEIEEDIANARSCLATWGETTDYTCSCRTVVALTAERDRYKAALEKYGRHLSYCSYRPHGVGETAKFARGECTCGFNEGLCNAALSPTPPKEP